MQTQIQTSDQFISWLEGYLDASKNKVTVSQVREIRKKIFEFKKNEAKQLIPIYDGEAHLLANNLQNNSVLNEEFIREVEKAKNASTMEDLSTY